MYRQAEEIRAAGTPGHCEGLTAFDAWLVENVDACADATSGDVEYGAWFALAGRRIVSTDDRGFWYVSRFTSREEARDAFDVADREYGDWLDDGEDVEDVEEQCARPNCHAPRVAQAERGAE